MKPQDYFANADIINKRRYDALRAFFFDKLPAVQVAASFGYTISAFYSLTRDFRKHLKEDPKEDFFFKDPVFGRKVIHEQGLTDMIIDLRKQNFSAEDIVGIVNSKGHQITYGYVYNLLFREGFARLNRRSKKEKQNLSLPKIKAPVSEALTMEPERFHSPSTGIFTFLPFINKYKIDKLIAESEYPKTRDISKTASILSFVALKLSDIKRYSDDDLWCMDRGLGLFAGLNVLPKSAWLSSYSSRVTSDMNRHFLKSMHRIWLDHGLLSDTANLDFTTIPYWGDDAHLENNWSGKRNKVLSSMLTALAHDPDSGIIDYGNSDVEHANQSEVVLEYLDFYREGKKGSDRDIQYLVFDSKFTNYENLSKLDDKGIKFITIRRRGKNITEKVISDKNNIKTIRVETGEPKKRTLKVTDQMITLRDYRSNKSDQSKQVRQVAIISGHRKMRPALIITNDRDISTEQIVRKYARRWLVEKGISEQIEFFHLNRLSSSMVIKVDFDLTMTLLAHNLYRLLAMELQRYSSLTAERIYEKFISNNGSIEIRDNSIEIELKKKRDLPQVLELLKNYTDETYSWLGNKKLIFYPSATS